MFSFNLSVQWPSQNEIKNAQNSIISGYHFGLSYHFVNMFYKLLSQDIQDIRPTRLDITGQLHSFASSLGVVFITLLSMIRRSLELSPVLIILRQTSKEIF